MPKQIITYQTYDGRSFPDMEEARAHEDQEFAKTADSGAMLYVSQLLEECGTEPRPWANLPERSIVEAVIRRLFEAGKLK